MRRFRYLFFLTLLFFTAFLALYLVVGITIAADGSWPAIIVFVGYATIAFYLLLCFYSLKTSHEGANEVRGNSHALHFPVRQFSMDKESPSMTVRSGFKGDSNCVPIDYQEHL